MEGELNTTIQQFILDLFCSKPRGIHHVFLLMLISKYGLTNISYNNTVSKGVTARILF